MIKEKNMTVNIVPTQSMPYDCHRSYPDVAVKFACRFFHVAIKFARLC